MYGLALRRDISRDIRRHRPDVVVAQSWGERFGGGMVNQADHRAVGLATLDAVADAGQPLASPSSPTRVSSPGAGSRRLAVAGSAGPAHYVDVSGEHFGAWCTRSRRTQAYNAALPDTFPHAARAAGMILGGVARRPASTRP